MASLNSASDQLISALVRLGQKWHSAAEVWHDPVSHDFEARYWALIEPTTQPTIEQMKRLAVLIEQARREVK